MHSPAEDHADPVPALIFLHLLLGEKPECCGQFLHELGTCVCVCVCVSLSFRCRFKHTYHLDNTHTHRALYTRIDAVGVELVCQVGHATTHTHTHTYMSTHKHPHTHTHTHTHKIPGVMQLESNRCAKSGTGWFFALASSMASWRSCVCVCVCKLHGNMFYAHSLIDTHTHSHTHTCALLNLRCRCWFIFARGATPSMAMNRSFLGFTRLNRSSMYLKE
jgi:hypothetical protein